MTYHSDLSEAAKANIRIQKEKLQILKKIEVDLLRELRPVMSNKGSCDRLLQDIRKEIKVVNLEVADLEFGKQRRIVFLPVER